MVTKKKYSNKKLPILLTVIALVVAGVIACFIFQDTLKTVTTDITSSIQNQDRPKFELDTAKLSNWVTLGNTFHTDEQDRGRYTAMLVSQCAENSGCASLVDDQLMADKCQTATKQRCEKLQQATDAGACTVHFYHFNYPVDPDKAITDFLKPNPGFKVAMHEVGTKTLSLHTSAGDHSYQLHQYHSDNKTGTYKQGIALAFIPLQESHVEIKATCDLSSQLDTITPILGAVRLAV